MKNKIQVAENQQENNIEKLKRLEIVMSNRRFKDVADLAKAISYSQGYLSEIFNNKKKVPKTMGQKLEDFIGVSRKWFETGEGDFEMGSVTFNDPTPKIERHDNRITPSINKDKKGAPYFDIDFMGGFDLVFNDHSIEPIYYIDFLPFNDVDCWINVSGKSMGPLIAHGDIVALKQVENWQGFLLEGEIYAIVTNNGFRTIKMIGAGPDKDHYMLIPYNKSPDYSPQAIPKKVITHIFRVKGAIKKFF